jgi:hypothetical protein
VPQHVLIFFLDTFLFLLVSRTRSQTSSVLTLLHRIANRSEEIGRVEVSHCPSSRCQQISEFLAHSLLRYLLLRRLLRFTHTHRIRLGISFLLNGLHLLDFPQPIENISKITLLQSLLQKDLRTKIVRTYVLVIFCVYEIDNVVIFDGLSINLHLELIVWYQFEDSLGNILVYDEISTRFQHSLDTTFLTHLYLLVIFLFYRHFDLWWVDRKLRIVSSQIAIAKLMMIPTIQE